VFYGTGTGFAPVKGMVEQAVATGSLQTERLCSTGGRHRETCIVRSVCRHSGPVLVRIQAEVMQTGYSRTVLSDYTGLRDDGRPVEHNLSVCNDPVATACSTIPLTAQIRARAINTIGLSRQYEEECAQGNSIRISAPTEISVNKRSVKSPPG